MSNHFPKLIDTSSYHLWTDALHARALANQANNKWNRDTYVRWTVTTAWTAFEMACKDAVEASRLGHDFKRNLNQAVEALSLPKLNWGRGIWQQVTKVYDLRKEYIHVGVSDEPIFREVAEADFAILTLRNAIKIIYQHAHKSFPAWVDDNDDPGWDRGHGSLAHSMTIRAGANENDPDAIKLAYIFKDREYMTEVLPAGIDPSSSIENLITAIRVPISSIRAYKGNNLIQERKLRMRGS